CLSSPRREALALWPTSLSNEDYARWSNVAGEAVGRAWPLCSAWMSSYSSADGPEHGGARSLPLGVRWPSNHTRCSPIQESTVRKRVFISFDYDHDRNYRYLLSALCANPRSDLDFDDLTPEEIDTSDVGRVKAVLTRKIRDATHTLVIVGAHANSYHRDSAKIGTRNWQW